MKNYGQGLLLALVLLAAGCMQIEQDLALNRDGSGVMQLAYMTQEGDGTLAQQAAREFLRQSLTISGGTARLPQDMSDAEIRKEFAGYAPWGVKLERLSTERKAGRMVRRVTISFKSLQGLTRALLPERTVRLSRDTHGNYLLTQQPGDGASAASRLASAVADDSNPLVPELFKGFRATLRVTAPGRVVEANAVQAEQNTATWRFDFDQDPQAVNRLLQQSMRLVFDGRGLNLTPFVQSAGTR
ncbi:MAG: hypothetical protein EPN23_08585 [Verrucomicrobia bacterium]|nr:MAG: hypothetical protein EPN23_08585 [Verrucomicrobiota bacterium]